MTKMQTFEARPLLGFEILENPDQPTIPLLVLKTVEGATGYMVRRDVLEQIGQAFLAAASQTPGKLDQH
jgi:hypothetical protein